MKKTSRAKSVTHEESNKIAKVVNSSYQLKIPEDILNRSRSSQDITEILDVMSKESLDNKVKIRLSQINKHVSDGINKDRENQKGAKEFSKSEAELVDVIDTSQHAISTIEKEVAKNLAFFAEGNRHREHEQHQESSHQKEDLKVKSLQRTVTMMMKRTTEQITDVSRGNTAAFVGIDQYLYTVEDVHNTADDWIHVVAKITVKSKDRHDSIRN